MSECEQTNRAGAYHDDEMSAGERDAFEAHLMGCQQCAAELIRLRKLSGLLVCTSRPAMSQRTMKRLHSRVDFDPAGRGIRRLAGVLAAAAMVVLVACVFQLFVQAPAQAETVVLPMWEVKAVVQPTTEPAASDSDELLARWMVQDLAIKGASHE